MGEVWGGGRRAGGRASASARGRAREGQVQPAGVRGLQGWPGSGCALEAPSLQAVPMDVMPASSQMIQSPGWLRGGEEGRTARMGDGWEAPAPPACSTLWLHSVPRGPTVLPNGFASSPRLPRVASAPRAWAEVGPWRLQDHEPLTLHSEVQPPGKDLLPNKLNLYLWPAVASWCQAAQGRCPGIKIKLDNCYSCPGPQSPARR